MIEETVSVLKVEGATVWVAKLTASACSSCATRCTSSWLDAMRRAPPEGLKLQSQLHLNPGDNIVIGIPENALLIGAFRIFFLPLVVALFVATLAQQLSGSESIAALAGAASLALAFLALRFSRFLNGVSSQPIILRKI